MTSEKISERIQKLAASQISDVMDRFGVVNSSIKPVWKGARLVGQAKTVLTAAGDNQIIHSAIPQIRPGEVLVVNGFGEENRALIGELIAERARRQGCNGFLIDGAVRDAEEIESLDFPVFARAVTPAGPYRNGPGKLDIPVAIGGVVVNPGDWVYGDSDGVVIIPSTEIEQILTLAEEKKLKELNQQRDIRAGLIV